MVRLLARLLYPLYRELKLLYLKEFVVDYEAKLLRPGDMGYLSLDKIKVTPPAAPVTPA